mmetsp:Transcript_10290/g.13424  ORF Transcript_10290/g.13424 Transcript_10290/m.13424 type:complete len:253 (+) Transcript_10290:173-931(+)
MGITPNNNPPQNTESDALLLANSKEVVFSLNESLGFRLYSGDEDGLIVSGVNPGGQAEAKGVVPGFRIVALDGRMMYYQDELLGLVEQSKDQGSLTVSIFFVESEGGHYGDDGGMEEELASRIAELETELLRTREQGASTVLQISEAFNAAKVQYEEKIKALESLVEESKATPDESTAIVAPPSSRRTSQPPPRGESEPRSIGSVTSPRKKLSQPAASPRTNPGRTNGSFDGGGRGYVRRTSDKVKRNGSLL